MIQGMKTILAVIGAVAVLAWVGNWLVDRKFQRDDERRRGG